MNPETTAIRGKDWIFNALWSASGDSSVLSCKINIPITALFRDGKPYRCLNTNPTNGLVSRLFLDAMVPERVAGDQGFRGYSHKEIRLLRQILIQFSDENNYGSTQKYLDEPFVCKVCKRDLILKFLAYLSVIL